VNGSELPRQIGPRPSTPTALRILLVEDQPDDAALLVCEPQRAGFTPSWKRVDTEKDFLARLDPPPDLIVADYALPQFNGLDALRALHARELTIPFIMVTGALGDQEAALDGTQVLRAIRADPRTRRLPVVVLTSSSDEEDDLQACYNLGCNTDVAKPVSFDDLLESARQLGLYWLILNGPAAQLTSSG
jgi:two-component system, response regulator